MTVAQKINTEQLANRMLTGFARVRRQIKGSLFTFENGHGEEVTLAYIALDPNKPIAACALGCLALGYKEKPGDLESSSTYWPSDMPAGRAIHPTRNMRQDVRDIIVNLNDEQGWTIEEIAEWLRKAEIEEYS